MARKLTHWEYSFLLHTCNLGESQVTRTNPFTGEPVIVHIDDGLSVEERRAIQAVFAEHGIEGPEPDFEGYAMCSDDDSLRFRCDDLDGDAPISNFEVEVVVKQLSDELLAIVLDVARAGNLALMSSVGDCVRIAHDAPAATLIKRWPDAEPLSSIADLREWLQQKIEGRRVRISS